mgnify:CR=1 FL=1
MENFTITIARQYGSGGRTVGKMLAEKLAVPFYDKQIIQLASDESGIDVKLFGQVEGGMSVKPSLFNKSGLYKGELIPPTDKGFISDENLFNYQAKIIKKLAEQDESCIIVGRCAEYVLKDYDNVLSVFIHAPHEYCMEQAAKKQSMGSKELERYIQKIDKHRADYHKYYTGLDWTDARNYDLCLDSSKLGFERCVQEIMSYINVRFN